MIRNEKDLEIRRLEMELQENLLKLAYWRAEKRKAREEYFRMLRQIKSGAPVFDARPGVGE